MSDVLDNIFLDVEEEEVPRAWKYPPVEYVKLNKDSSIYKPTFDFDKMMYGGYAKWGVGADVK